MVTLAARQTLGSDRQGLRAVIPLAAVAAAHHASPSSSQAKPYTAKRNRFDCHTWSVILGKPLLMTWQGFMLPPIRGKPSLTPRSSHPRSSNMQTREKELSARMLDDIGTTPDKVATTLRAYGIRGMRNSTRYFNPIVQYVYRQFANHALHIDVKSGTTLTISSENGVREIPLPPAVIGFLVRFNDGKYPDVESDALDDIA